MNRFVNAIKQGVTGIQAAYSRQRAAAEKRADQAMAAAKTKYEKERIRAEAEREKLKLQRQMYEAKAAVIREKEAVARAKKAAGGGGIGKFVSDTGKSFRQMQRSFYGETTRKRRVAHRKK